MRQSSRRLAIALLFAAWLPSAAAAQVPSHLNHQGILTDSNGVVVPDGQYLLEFGIYDAPAAGTLRFEQQLSVNVVGGLYNVLLSDNGSWVLKDAFDDPNRFLQIRIVTSPGGAYDDLTLEPRQQIASVPFAFRAESAQPAALEPGIEVEYDQSTSNASVGAGYSDVPGLEVILTPPGPFYVIRVTGVVMATSGNAVTDVECRIEENGIGYGTQRAHSQRGDSSGDMYVNFNLIYMNSTPVAGNTYTYHIECYNNRSASVYGGASYPAELYAELIPPR